MENESNVIPVGVRVVFDGYDDFVIKMEKAIEIAERFNSVLETLCSNIERLKNALVGFRKE